MLYSEGLDTTGFSDLASGWGYEETRTNQGSCIIYITENPVRQHHLSMHRARCLDYWLRLACWGWPAGIISTCFYFIYLRSAGFRPKPSQKHFAMLRTRTTGWETYFPSFQSPTSRSMYCCHLFMTAPFKLDLIRLFSISDQRSSWISCKCPPYWFCKGRKYLRNGCNFKLAQMQQIYC